ncbi:hypothetical protein Tco_0926452 [Tanacetum coccineum]|uniref:Retrovirus-related Pol polyprotein from transposon TNT 1-94-like beta-barrel domain-containing protein n=1 Tax=Tanacetum coccineum TaxID=301880 RepID=A0ABQ5DBU1_9ASTR
MRTTVILVPTRNQSWNVGSVARLVTSKGIVVVVDAIAWWIDSGATTHVCKDHCWFKTYEPVEDGYDLDIITVDMCTIKDCLKVKEDLIPAIVMKIAEKRIIHDLQLLTTHSKNGVAERKNKALKKMVNSIVHSFKVVNHITKHRVPIETSPVQVKEKSPERIHEVELEEDPEEDLKDDLEEEEEPKKKRLKEASESDSNTLPPDYTAPNKESETDLDFTARWNGNGGNRNDGNNNGCTYKKFLACKLRDFDGKREAITLTQWIEMMESVMDISGCVIESKSKEEFKALLVEEFCPSNEMESLKPNSGITP